MALCTSCLLVPCQKLVYLEQFLGGEALNAVKGFIIQNTSEAYKAARSYLDWMYGDPYDMADEYREKLESWPKISDSDVKGLREYADFLNEILVATSTNIELSTLNDPRILKGFPNVLPNNLIQKWARLAGTMKYEQNRHARFEEYCHFVKKEAFLANDNTTSMEAIKASYKRSEKKGIPGTVVTHTTSAVPNEEISKSKHAGFVNSGKSKFSKAIIRANYLMTITQQSVTGYQN